MRGGDRHTRVCMDMVSYFFFWGGYLARTPPPPFAVPPSTFPGAEARARAIKGSTGTMTRCIPVPEMPSSSGIGCCGSFLSPFLSFSRQELTDCMFQPFFFLSFTHVALRVFLEQNRLSRHLCACVCDSYRIARTHPISNSRFFCCEVLVFLSGLSNKSPALSMGLGVLDYPPHVHTRAV